MDKGVDVHAQANPTQLEYLRKSYRKKKARTVCIFIIYLIYFIKMMNLGKTYGIIENKCH